MSVGHDHDALTDMPLERWETMERTVVTAGCALLFCFSAWTLAIGSRLFWLTLFLWPFMLWAVWQSFFDDRLDAGAPPSRPERAMATAWLWFRRIVLGAVAVTSGYLGVQGLFINDGVAVLVGFFVCLVAILVAAFGSGSSTVLTWGRPLHMRRKARYKWWF